MSLITPLRELGDAEYHLEFDFPEKKLHMPWSYKTEDDERLIPQEPEHKWIGFSRVSFSRAHDKALFAMSDSCRSSCGGGFSIYAHKDNGTWVFENGGCFWMY